jgi:hypothetical protein
MFTVVFFAGTDSLEYQQKLVSAGACEAVTKALLKYSEYESIAQACFRSLVVLLLNNVAYKSKLGALGVCGCVVEAMHQFPYSAQVAKWGCRAVAVLAESHEANIARLGTVYISCLHDLCYACDFVTSASRRAA